MKLQELLAGMDIIQRSGPTDLDVQCVACDSRRVEPGSFFFTLCGEKADGNLFVNEAIERGAVAVASELPRPPNPQWAALDVQGGVLVRDLPASVAWIELEEGSARRGLAVASANFYRHPAESLDLVGVTGTNGKTTTAYLIDSILRSAGRKTGLLGTTGYRTPRGSHKAVNTTPESLDLQRILAEVRDAGGAAAVLEASSHSLVMDRLWGCRFAVAVFTNLTRDHLDYHKTFEDYFAAKRRLFEGTGAGGPFAGVINADDPYSARLAELAQRTLSYGIQNSAQISTRKFSLTLAGLAFDCQTPAGTIAIQSRLVGRINVYNILAAIGAALALDLPLESIAAGVRQLENVPGRFERIDEGQDFFVFVDYAHTDDALRKLISTARELNPKGRVITLFGAGGDRDRTKRPLMGEAAGSLSDLVILTSDNPRSEDPLRIINDVVVGLQKASGKYQVEPDRERAIEVAMEEARPGDILLLAGKGHENYQILRDRTLEFDDREVVRCALRRRGHRHAVL